MGGPTTWFAVAIGGALGSLARFWVGAAMALLTGPRFPWGTLLINVLGSFIIGLVAGLTLTPTRMAMHPDLRIFLMVGICGGFTTFSAFSLQTLELMQSGEGHPQEAAPRAAAQVRQCMRSARRTWKPARWRSG
jgi:CrcB protein